MKLEQTVNPSDRDIDFLTQKINSEIPLGHFHRDEEREIVASCCGLFFKDQLWVDSNHRNSGAGKLSVESVHQYGRSLCCSKATACTMSFKNSVLSYQKVGFTHDFERPGSLNDSCCLVLSKEL